MPKKYRHASNVRRKKAKERFSRILVWFIVVITVIVVCFTTVVAVGIELGKKADKYMGESQYGLNNTQIIAE